VVTSYIHSNFRVGVLLEINCETDFVAKTDDFKRFAQDIAMQIAAMNPDCVRREEFDPAVLEKEKQIAREKAIAEGKPEKILDRIVEGQVNKILSERVLLEQEFVKESKKSVKTLLEELVAKVGENVQIRRFVRYELGEGLEKRKDDFAAEVAAQVKG
jgi:elongation factor Ts